MKHKARMLSKSPRWRRFTTQRDQALERLLLKTRAKVSDEFRRAMNLTRDEIERMYPQMTLGDIDPHTIYRLRELESRLDSHFISVATLISQHWYQFRRQAFLLSFAAEQLAIINSGVDIPLKKINAGAVMTATYSNTMLGDIPSRTYYTLSKIRREIMTKLDLSRILQDDLQTALKRALSAFPSPQFLSQQRVFRRIKEASAKESWDDRFDFDFMDPSEMEDLVNAYKEEFIPKWRDPRAGELEAPVSVGDHETYAVYPWELENEMTEDFVKQVRDGEHEAAKENGITDFVWVAVVDDRTDDDCLIRDGLLTSEIDETITDGLGSSPPIHFNCRCRLVPATDDIPEVPESNEVEFNDWLNS